MRENLSNRKRRFALALGATVVMALGAASTARAQYNYEYYGGYVKPCSLDGVNPAYHPKIFGNPATARAYGFVRARDGSWRVSPDCNRRPY